jgi:hypothetical protein
MYRSITSYFFPCQGKKLKKRKKIVKIQSPARDSLGNFVAAIGGMREL